GRLFNAALGGQAGWLLGVGLAGLVAGIVVTRLRRRDPRTGWIVLLAGSWLVSGIVFSEAKGIFHPYYASFMAPFTPALVGAAAGLARERPWVAPAAVVGGVVSELLVLGHVSGQFSELPALLIGAGAAAVAALVAGVGPRVRPAVLAAMLGLLLWAPATWAV